ncbi:metallophosphoesterase [Clostridium sp. MSJ-11]|uniref:Metallophosphoesterase n=1 Tax=Clostridium mobile TaxID=2841512 RepID=A0ABS6EFR8_9CLOT|nr:metallophosphoesterase [Clostridium mobile]MBU5484069.1 metallophosphoesterase [Clostridium mobile]
MKKIIIALAAISVFIYAQFNWLEVSEYKISSDKIGNEFDGFKIVQLSDLHSKEFGKNNSTLIKKIKKLNPDIIVTTGDMYNSTNDDGEVFYNLAKELSKDYKIYYIVGNHEQISEVRREESEVSKENNYIESLKELGVTVLDNDKVEIEREGKKINLYGLEIPLRFYKDKNTATYSGDKPYDKSNVEKAIGKASEEDFNILLAHNPIYFPVYSSWGADLTLSGHTHGGIIRIPFKGGLLSPERTFFPKYDGGEFELDESKLIVNRGLGNDTIKLRIFNRPEISVITLKSSED